MDDNHVTEVDAFTMQLERDPLLRSTIVAIALFDRSPEWSQLTERIDRASRLAPTFRMKLVPTPLRLAPPRWVVDPDFDLSWHLRRARVPAGGGFEAVLDYARIAGMTAFDHERPLWEFTLLEGLPRGPRGARDEGAPLADRRHRRGVVGRARRRPHPGARGPARCARAQPRANGHGAFEPLLEALGHDVRHLADLAGGLVRHAPAMAADALHEPVHAATSAVRTVGSVANFVRPVLRTASPVMRDRRLRWHYDTLDVPTDGLLAAGHDVHGTLNDAFVAAIAGGFRLYHERHGAGVDELHISMPISTRGDAAGLAGNQVTLVRFAVPVGIESPALRTARIGQLCRAARAEPALEYSNLIAGVFNLLPVSVTGGMLKHVDLLASNVPGFPNEVFIAGARLDAFYPFGPTIGSSANVTLVSYAGTCNIGVNTDAGAVPDPAALLACLREGFDEVLAISA